MLKRTHIFRAPEAPPSIRLPIPYTFTNGHITFNDHCPPLKDLHPLMLIHLPPVPLQSLLAYARTVSKYQPEYSIMQQTNVNLRLHWPWSAVG